MFNDISTDVPSELPCVTLKTRYGTAPICTYAREIDVYVSSNIRSGSIYESDLVYKLEAMFREKPDLLFDIGCNIGTYTIAIARLGRSVVAADALTDNLQLLNKSLTMGNLQRHVTLIWNAVSDIRGTMTFVVPRDNVAGTIEKETITTETAFLKTGRRFDVRSIVLDDFIHVPMLKDRRVLIKMDIEGHE